MGRWYTPEQRKGTVSLNKVMLIGNLGKDVELSETNSGKKVGKFSLATKEGKDKTTWHNIVVWENLAELCAQYLSKGRQCYVEGSISHREYEKDGEKKYFTEINAYSVKFLSSGQQAEERKVEAPSFTADDIPF